MSRDAARPRAGGDSLAFLVLGKVRRPTVTPTNKSITAVYGQPLTLTMEFCANPLTIKFYG
ncbi:hypothetical protein NQ317_014028 [Molorchus minor]|uniref:Uncharacterized protein n=1 Tax=Molorchus minor TaxID=1323400 RepID=A0ABQ9JWM2_9CUCU|nr:hypothetical protein NQ317_014028 [Molorchus minor]